MCLSIVGCRKKAKEDIPVWKVLKVRKINDNLTQYRSPHYDHDDDVDVAAKEAAYDLDAELELPPIKGMFPDIPSYIAGFKKGADWEKSKLLNTIIK